MRIMSTELLDGRTCLMTGSSRGIGLGVARALTNHGGTVILHGREEKTLRSALASLKGLGATHILAADLSDHDGIERLEAEIARCFGTLHVLIQSAGILGLKVPLAEYPAEVWGEVTWSTTATPKGCDQPFILHKDAGER
ncbi:MAG: gluconate 5-dehydrogenase [Deltaproteobacteria bacterium]|nr:gluconate 5-dehydrogenase [Deltaproteobacteria bacterium]